MVRCKSYISSIKGCCFRLPIEMTDINDQTGLVVRSGKGIETVVLMHVEKNSIRNLYFVRNPDKLRHLLK
jgi:RNA polymerase sigma-70 factor (ECF subfamily)